MFRFLFQTIAVLILMASQLTADNTSSVYIVDFGKVVKGSKAAKSAKKTVDKSLAKQKQELMDQSKKLQAMKSDLQRQAAVLSRSAAEEKAASVRSFEKDLRRQVQDFEDQLKTKHARIIDSIASQAEKLVQELAEKESYDFVLMKGDRAIVYSDKRIDITERVVEILNKRNIKVNL